VQLGDAFSSRQQPPFLAASTLLNPLLAALGEPFSRTAMASHVVVIATDLRRTTIKVSPGTYLTDVLQEACRKLNLPADKYIVKYVQSLKKI
jgi:hypothetical protein